MNQDLSRRWQLLAITAVIGYLIWLLGPVLMPFAIAAMLGYLGDPLADRLERWGLSRNWAATLVFLVLLFAFGGVLLLLVPLVSRQVESVIQNLPNGRKTPLGRGCRRTCIWTRTRWTAIVCWLWSRPIWVPWAMSLACCWARSPVPV